MSADNPDQFFFMSNGQVMNLIIEKAFNCLEYKGVRFSRDDILCHELTY